MLTLDRVCRPGHKGLLRVSLPLRSVLENSGVDRLVNRTLPSTPAVRPVRTFRAGLKIFEREIVNSEGEERVI